METEMRKIIVGAFTSLDGVMQAPGGPEEDPTHGFKFGGWFAPLVDDKTGEIIGEMLGKPFDLLLGRKTYDIFAAHWPYVDKDDPIGPLFDRITKFVATRDASRKLTWQNSEPLGSDVVATLKKLKQSDGPDLLTQGSADFLKTLFAEGLVDQVNIFIAPVILGKGKRLFGDDGKPTGLKLVSSSTTPSGIVVARYVPDGAVKTGSFEFETPTDAELERRRKLT
jgi:dihydrofolate reductase